MFQNMPNTETSRGKRAKTNLRPVHRHNLRSMVSILSDEDDDSDSNLDIHDNKLDDSTKSVVNLNKSKEIGKCPLQVNNNNNDVNDDNDDDYETAESYNSAKSSQKLKKVNYTKKRQAASEKYCTSDSDDDSEYKPKKKKLILQSTLQSSVSTHRNDIGFVKRTSNNNNNNSSSSSNCDSDTDENDDKSDQNLSNIFKDKNVTGYFNCVKSEDENELEKELMELRRHSPRQTCVNVNDNKSTKCKFFIKNLKNCQTTAEVDTNHMPRNSDLLNHIKTMKNQFKFVYEPKRTRLYKKLVKTPEHLIVFNLKEGYSKITADEGMVNLFDALNSFEKNYQYNIKFVKSKLGDALQRYTANRDICMDVVHLESNYEEDLLKYRLCYGAIPKKYILELEIIVCRLLLGKLYDENKILTDSVKQSDNMDYDLLEGELELLIFNYWQKSTCDMFTYKEHLSREMNKRVFYYMYKQLETTITRNDFGKDENRRIVFINILKLYKSYAAFENHTILTAAGLAFVKNFASKLLPFIWNQYELWSIFFQKFNMHSMAFEHTIKDLLESRDSIFQYLFTRVSEIDQFNIYRSTKSLWYYGIEQNINSSVEVEDTIISKTDVVNCLSYYFTTPAHVPRSLCVKLDNYYFLYIDLFVSFIINSNLHKYQKKLTTENCKHFFILNDRKYHDYYLQNFIPTFETTRMVTAMKTMLKNQLNARLDGNLSWNMKMKAEVTYMFFELVHLHLNYTLTPAMLREGPALTSIQWASIFISDLDKMERFYLEGLRWEEKPWMLGGTTDDFDYDPETDDVDDPLKNLCSAELSVDDESDDEEYGYEYSTKFGASTDEQTDFNSDDSEAEGSVMVKNKTLIKKKLKRLMDECQHLGQGDDHKIFNRKLSKKIPDGINKKDYSYKSTQIKLEEPDMERNDVSPLKVKVKVKKPPVKKLKSVQTLKSASGMVEAGVFDVYKLENDETHVITPEGVKVFGLFSKSKINSGHRSCIGCTLCPDRKITKYNILVSENVAVASCLTCIEVVAGIIKTTRYTFEKLQNVMKKRIDFRFKSPILFDKHRQILTKIPPMLSHKDMNTHTYNKFDPKYGRRLPTVDAFNDYCKFEDQQYLVSTVKKKTSELKKNNNKKGVIN
ncbi:uncharacterized protein LOC100570535 [Acyrthosiphon pisum]|uniref:Uncharacterized protein n=1 Tax=Acyrthosiphon pisum TaxID=7029 RepID=A0A8R2D750_ACYPI|nr:uncharacterized protein LOC100570535 [Acyrthosiphon pisum]XP_016662569.1 uncharacterized protein LOC100570535 [Acyrthosiphon pisum]|eukprot:XP_016662568.1 PREDICTED: uncharacterized protein LOC100570535 [Acyrthosiphon pisum]